MALRFQQVILLTLLCCVCIEIVGAASAVALKPGAGRRKKRSLWDLAGMIDCGIKEVGSRAGATARYGNYGCHCGVGGSGRTLDKIDECCKDHDKCYRKAGDKGCWPNLKPYGWRCSKSTPKCTKEGSWWSGLNSKCQWEVCECDREMVGCFKKHNKVYTIINAVHINRRGLHC